MNGRWIGCSIHLLVLMFLCIIRFTATFKQQGGCYFPERWEGTWFQSGVRQPIIIDGPRLSSKGRCLRAEVDKFLVVDEKTACYRCVVIHEKHPNVLQYKETFCYSRDALPRLCSLITGDALLFSMFRENAAPVSCPFHGSFAFTYNRGHGECRTPVSSIDTCTEDSKLLLSYQACPDVYGSESAVEELQCLAMWKEGSSRYLVGKMHHSHATSNEDRFRCFVYEKTSPASELHEAVDYRVSQSGDATCNGLFSATEGSRTMVLKRVSTLNKCNFPTWLTNYNHWYTLDFSTTFTFHYHNSTLRITNTSSSAALEMKVVCTQIKQVTRDENAVILLAHFTMGCQSGFMCMALYRRDGHVVETQLGGRTKRQEDACYPTHFNRTLLPYVTLVTNSPESRPCPYLGKFDISNIIQYDDNYGNRQDEFAKDFYGSNHKGNFQRLKRIDYQQPHTTMKKPNLASNCDTSVHNHLIFGCTSIDTMDFKASCATSETVKTYTCQAQWQDNGTNYLIATPVISRSVQGAKRYCFIYKEIRPELLQFSTISGNGCDRTLIPGINGDLVFNITGADKCSQSSSGGSTSAQRAIRDLRQTVISFSILYIQYKFILR